MNDKYFYYFVYNDKDELLYIRTFDKNNPPTKLNNKTIKYLKFSFARKDEKFTTDLLNGDYQPKYRRIVFSK